jgi:hypothetical protein
MSIDQSRLERVKQIMQGLPLEEPAYEDPQEEIAFYFQHAAKSLRASVEGRPAAGQSERIRDLAAQTPDPVQLQRLLQAESWVPLRIAAITAEGVALKIPNPDNN